VLFIKTDNEAEMEQYKLCLHLWVAGNIFLQ
jgi:hypothetical protein